MEGLSVQVFLKLHVHGLPCCGAGVGGATLPLSDNFLSSKKPKRCPWGIASMVLILKFAHLASPTVDRAFSCLGPHGLRPQRQRKRQRTLPCPWGRWWRSMRAFGFQLFPISRTLRTQWFLATSPRPSILKGILNDAQTTWSLGFSFDCYDILQVLTRSHRTREPTQPPKSCEEYRTNMPKQGVSIISIYIPYVQRCTQ